MNSDMQQRLSEIEQRLEWKPALSEDEPANISRKSAKWLIDTLKAAYEQADEQEAA